MSIKSKCAKIQFWKQVNAEHFQLICLVFEKRFYEFPVSTEMQLSVGGQCPCSKSEKNGRGKRYNFNLVLQCNEATVISIFTNFENF